LRADRAVAGQVPRLMTQSEQRLDADHDVHVRRDARGGGGGKGAAGGGGVQEGGQQVGAALVQRPLVAAVFVLALRVLREGGQGAHGHLGDVGGEVEGEGGH